MLGGLFERSTRKAPYPVLAKSVYNHFQDEQKRNSLYGHVVRAAQAKGTATAAEISDAMKRLKRALAKCCSNWDEESYCPIILSMDEVHILYTARGFDTGSCTVFSLWRSVLSELVTLPFCVLALSTVSRVVKLAPPKSIADSLREQTEDFDTPVPFTELPFDVYIVANPLTPGTKTIYSVGSFEFGRPMYVHSALASYKLIF
jgi:hypothetical protein